MSSANVLIVDDNKGYREAFKRNLLIEGYEVAEAEDSEEALKIIQERPLDVVVTDLAMRHPTEGLELIRQIRTLQPHLPVIMISAVGTFEEGAEASRLGARYVISKSKIDEELTNLFRAIDQASEEYQLSRQSVERIKELAIDTETNPAKVAAALHEIILNRKLPDSVKGLAFDLLIEVNSGELSQASQQDLNRIKSVAMARDFYAEVDSNLKTNIANFSEMSHETQESLRTAEFLYIHDEYAEKAVDFSRSIGFSYCFAVENEAKFRLRKKMSKFFDNASVPKLIRSLLEEKKNGLSIFFHQHLLRILRDIDMDITIDNVYQTLVRILEHGSKYKPDGLKALGIVILCFGRTYRFRKPTEEVVIENPLNVRGFDNDQDLIQFTRLLTNLQHYRNPYIHPEISDMQKLSIIRQTTFDAINRILRLA